MAEIDFDELLRQMVAAYRDQLTRIGTFNVIVFGEAGAGKSTLINALFGIDVAATGRGDRVTERVCQYRRHEDDPLTIYDTPGFQFGQGSGADLAAQIRDLVTERRHGPRSQHIHVVWFVVNHRTNRFHDGHADMVQELDKLGLPVMIVMTHVAALDGLVEEGALELADEIQRRQLPLSGGNRVFLVNSRPISQLGGPELGVHGLQELMEATKELLPEVADALDAVNVLDLSSQRRNAARIIRVHRRLAVLAGASAGVPIPVPLVDVGALVVVLGTMMARISAAYALPMGATQLAGVAATAMLGSGATTVGAEKGGEWLAREGSKLAAKQATKRAAKRAAKQAAKLAAKQAAAKELGKALATEGAKQVGKQGGKQVVKLLGKFVPVANVVIGTVSAVAAVGLATAVGHAWMRTCEYLVHRPHLIDQLDTSELARLFRRFYERKGSTAPTDGPEPNPA